MAVDTGTVMVGDMGIAMEEEVMATVIMMIRIISMVVRKRQTG